MGFGWFYVHMYYILKSLYRFCFEDLFKLFVISPVSEYAYFPTTYYVKSSTNETRMTSYDGFLFHMICFISSIKLH